MKIFTTLIGLLLSFYAYNQPDTWKQPYNPEVGLKPNQYLSKAKNALKRGNYYVATYNAALALSISQKKRHIAKAHEFLKQSYDRTIDDKEYTIETLEGQTGQYADHSEANNKQKIWLNYRELRNLTRLLKRIPKDLFKAQKRKERDLFLQLKDYSSQAKQAQANFQTSKAKSAAVFYEQGIELRENETLPYQRRAAKAFKMAGQYVPDYKDAADLYKEARENAITRLGVLEFSSSDQAKQYGELGPEVSDKLLTAFLSKGSKNTFEFFELVSRDQLKQIIEEQKFSVSGLFDESSTVELGNLKGVHYLLVGKITTADVSNEKSDPQTKTVKREVVVKQEKYKDKDGKEKTRDIKGIVKADVTTYGKYATGIIKGSYKIIDVKTGAIHTIKAFKGEANFETSWGSFKGDKRALSYSERRLVNREEKPFPSDSKLLDRAIDNMLSEVVSKLYDFAREVGQ